MGKPARNTEAISLGRGLFALTFVLAGVMHFLLPRAYLKIMPPYLPYPRFLVFLSGVFEILGGLGALLPQPHRRRVGWGMVALLVAIFPANIEIARRGVTWGETYVSPIWGWLRLPFQFLFIRWALAVTQEPKAKG
jgi:uncharacterized membrane protein